MVIRMRIDSSRMREITTMLLSRTMASLLGHPGLSSLVLSTKNTIKSITRGIIRDTLMRSPTAIEMMINSSRTREMLRTILSKTMDSQLDLLGLRKKQDISREIFLQTKLPTVIKMRIDNSRMREMSTMISLLTLASLPDHLGLKCQDITGTETMCKFPRSLLTRLPTEIEMTTANSKMRGMVRTILFKTTDLPPDRLGFNSPSGHLMRLPMEMRKKTLRSKMKGTPTMMLCKIMDLPSDRAGFKLEMISERRLS